MLIDKHSRTPLYEQVIAQVERGILTGEFAPDAQIPSVRALSMELSVNPNTLQKAYAELERRGLCYSVPGNGRFVSADAADKLRTMKRELLERVALLARELRVSGVQEEEVIKAVRTAYADGDGIIGPNNKKEDNDQ
ncbi:MAG: GntR family transcriptional regulator [Clostridia bacterium]|nr:GntR family transcriptional regulator [Clostridia bacterium]MBQ5487697.1 GntR family transcriptional regulator [Clostridia bacterium]